MSTVPADCDRPARLPRHAGPGLERARAAGQGAEGRADGARLRPHDLRRQLHGGRQGLPGRRHPPRRRDVAVRPSPGRPRADQEEARLPGRLGLRDRGHHLRDRRPDRSRGGGLHARDRHPQGLLDRDALARGLRDAPGPRRPGLFHRRAVRAHDARCADQHDRRGGQRGPQGVHRAGRDARHRRGVQIDPGRA